jgi:hypothetical protein
MKKIICCIAVVALTLSGCNGNKKKAQARLDNAQAMFENNELFAAKNEIDSIRILYPKEFKVLKETLTLMRLVERKEAERTLAYCDSLLPIKIAEAEVLKKNFVFEKDSAYEEIGNYIWRQQTIERNTERCYIRCGVNEKGEMYLASVYYGANPINHTSVKLSTNNGMFAETASIAYDGGMNYRFKDDGFISEIVTYKGTNGLDAINLIYNNENERVRIEYAGDKPFIIYMAAGDKKSVVETFNFGAVLSDIEYMTREKERASKRIEYLAGKINE